MRLIILLTCFLYCNQPISTLNSKEEQINKPKYINQIPLPKGFVRQQYHTASFGNWLQHLPLANDNTVYLYNHQPKQNQDLHSYVLDISVGNKNLQQCADAIMKLRALYFYSLKQWSNIHFKGTISTYNFLDAINGVQVNDTLKQLDTFLETVFINCGTYNLDSWLKPKGLKNIEVGDIFIKPGSPGHAMIVVDVAVNSKSGEQIYLLAQSYMPAQSIHIVKNINN